MVSRDGSARVGQARHPHGPSAGWPNDGTGRLPAPPCARAPRAYPVLSASSHSTEAAGFFGFCGKASYFLLRSL